MFTKLKFFTIKNFHTYFLRLIAILLVATLFSNQMGIEWNSCDINNIEVTENFEIEIEEIESEKESEEKEFLHQISTSTKPNAKLFVDVSEHIENNYTFYHNIDSPPPELV